MEVHVNSCEQIRKEDQHRRVSRKIFTPQPDQFGVTKHMKHIKNKQTHKIRTNKQNIFMLIMLNIYEDDTKIILCSAPSSCIDHIVVIWRNCAGMSKNLNWLTDNWTKLLLDLYPRTMTWRAPVGANKTKPHAWGLIDQMIFWGAKSKALKVPQSELTIVDRVSFQISSIQAAPQYAEYQMVRAKLVQIFPFNRPLGPGWPLPTADSAVFIFRINLWLCQVDAHKIFFNVTFFADV